MACRRPEKRDARPAAEAAGPSSFVLSVAKQCTVRPERSEAESKDIRGDHLQA
jgi:hypothetical protein